MQNLIIFFLLFLTESGDSNDLENDTTDPIELTGTTNATTIPAGDAQPDDDAPAGDASTLVRGAENGPAATLLPVECDGNKRKLVYIHVHFAYNFNRSRLIYATHFP